MWLISNLVKGWLVGRSIGNLVDLGKEERFKRLLYFSRLFVKKILRVRIIGKRLVEALVCRVCSSVGYIVVW